MTRNPVKSAVLGILAALTLASAAIAGAVANYPAATALDGTEKLVGTQAGATVNVTPAQIAAYVAGFGGVSSFNTRTGAVTLSSSDVTTALTFTPLSAAATSFAGSAAKWTAGRTISITGDLTYATPSLDGSANVTSAGTLATVNANIGSFGDTTHVGAFTVNAKGLVTAASSVAINQGVTSVTCGTGLSGGAITTTGTCSITAPVTVALGGTNATSASGTALDNISGFASTGFLTRTGAGAYAFQSATNGVTLANLAQGAANTMLGNWTGSTANVAANAMPSCSGTNSSLKYTSGTGVGCNSNTAILGANTFTSSQTISNASPITLDGAVGNNRSLLFSTSASNRWAIFTDNTAEGGANAGSNLQVLRYTDAGASIDSPILITRSSGLVSLADGVSVGGSIQVNTHVLCSATAPTISSGFGTTPSIVANNGTCSFQINVGTGGAATSGVIGLPAATAGWVCQATDITTTSATVFVTKQTASTTTTATVGNFNTSGAAAAWVASDKLNVSCTGY